MKRKKKVKKWTLTTKVKWIGIEKNLLGHWAAHQKKKASCIANGQLSYNKVKTGLKLV